MTPGGLWFCKVAWREHYDRGVTPSSLQVWVESPGPTMRLHGEGGGGESPGRGGRIRGFGCDRPWLVVSRFGCSDKIATFCCFIRNTTLVTFWCSGVSETKQS